MDSSAKEKQQLYSKFSGIVYKQRFKIMYGDDKMIFGVMSTNEQDSKMSKTLKYKTIYDTLVALDKNIKFSFEQAIHFAFSENATKNFHLVTNNNCEEEFLAYYFIENSLFRTSILWDMLAQFYNVFYELKFKKDKIHYKTFFDPECTHCSQFSSKANAIKNYINPKDDTDTTGMCVGNHKYVNGLRNQMTHRNSPNITTMSNFDFTFKTPPTYQLTRIIDDYSVASQFLNEILDDIETSLA